jgi:hypothetical protein
MGTTFQVGRYYLPHCKKILLSQAVISQQKKNGLAMRQFLPGGPRAAGSACCRHN